MFAILLSVFLVFIFSATGYFFLKKTQIAGFPILDNFLVSYGLGFGLYGTAIFFLGVLGLLKIECFFILTLVGVFLVLINLNYFDNLIHVGFRFIKKVDDSWLFRFLLISFAVYLVINTFVSLAPISSMDSLNYHFSLPKMYLREGKIINIEGYLYSHLPQLSEMVNAFVMGLSSDIAAAVLNSYFAIFCALLLFAVARKIFDKRVAIISASLFFCSSLLTWEATGGFVELPLTFFCLLSLYLALLYFETRSMTCLVLSGIFLGFAFSTKFLTVTFLIIISLIFLLRFFSGREMRGLIVKKYFLWLVLILIFGSHWYIYNYFTTGNPFFPLFYKIFGGKGWSYAINTAYFASLNSYGFGESLGSFLKVPFNLILKGNAFDHGELLGPLILTFIPFALIDRTNLKKVLSCLILSVVYLIIWFWGSQQARFVLPILPVLYLLVAIGYENITKSFLKPVRVLAKFTLVAFVVFSLCISLFFSKRFIKVIIGLETRNEFLSRTIWGYSCIEWMNNNLKKSDKVLFKAYGPYYLDIPYEIGGFGINWVADYSKYTNVDEFYQHLKSESVTHVFIWNHSAIPQGVIWDQLINKYLDKIYENRKTMSSRRSIELGDIEEVGTVYRLK